MAKKSEGQDTKVLSYAYDPNRRLLRVTFDDGESKTFTNVPPYVYDLFTQSVSKDRFFKEFITAVGYREVKVPHIV